MGVHLRYFTCYRAEFRIMPYYHLDECVSYHRHKSKTPITVHLQHTTGLFSGNRSGSWLSFTTIVHRSRNHLSLRCIGGGLLPLLQEDRILFPSIESLLILALLSIERYIAMKFSLRYASLITTPRLIGAVLCSWIISVISVILWLIPVTYSFAEVFVYVTVIPAIVIIVFCHATVYLVSRRHMRRIKTEQLPSETKTKFVEEKKAIKTTSIIIAFVFLSFVPSLLYGIFSRDIRQTNLRALVLSCIFLNSLLNPVIHCWRNKDLRKGMMELLKMRQNEN